MSIGNPRLEAMCHTTGLMLDDLIGVGEAFERARCLILVLEVAMPYSIPVEQKLAADQAKHLDGRVSSILHAISLRNNSQNQRSWTYAHERYIAPHAVSARC